MRAAPAVSVHSSGAGLWRCLNVLMPALAMAAVGAWVLAHAQWAAWPAVLLIPGVAVPLWLWAKTKAFAFCWDGQRWLSLGNDDVEEEGCVEVMLDLGPWLLLRWRPLVFGRGKRWVSVSSREARPDLHALRAAVYCGRPEPTPGTRSARPGRPAALPD